jgi:hypothetical protein
MTFEEDRDLFEDMGAFEAALAAKTVEIETPKLDAVVMALDGSNQVETARAFARAIGGVTGAGVSEVGSPKSADEIVAACAGKPTLLVIPVPFGRDIGETKDESLGAIVDLLLHGKQRPILCVRQPMDEAAVAACLRDAVLPVQSSDAQAVREAAWAFRLVERGGAIEILAVPDKEMIAEAKRLLADAVDPKALKDEALSRAITRDAAGLIAAVQKRGAALGIDVQVVVKAGRPAGIAAEEANARPRLLIVGAPPEHASAAAHRAADVVMEAKGPVLVV